jgi:Gluconate 2-dehydrogenase subunit 3
MDRRTTLKWVMAVGAAWPLLQQRTAKADPTHSWQGSSPDQGYGTDPNLTKTYRPGDFWPLTLTPDQRRLAAVLSDLIIPADEHSASASAVGVVDFIDEWVSAPYPKHTRDRPIVLEGFRWLGDEATRRSGKGFADLDAAGQAAICDSICDASRATAERRAAARFFALYRDLTAAAYYSSPAGRTDLGYIGNVPLASFDGAPPELLKKLNLT